MKKTILAILMASLMLATVFGVFSVNAAYIAEEAEAVDVIPPAVPCNISYGVYGYVYDVDTGDPIGGAIVICLETKDRTITYSDGYYDIPLGTDPPEVVTVKASKLGYWSDTKEADFDGFNAFHADFYLDCIIPDLVTSQLTSTTTRQSRIIR